MLRNAQMGAGQRLDKRAVDARPWALGLTVRRDHQVPPAALLDVRSRGGSGRAATRLDGVEADFPDLLHRPRIRRLGCTAALRYGAMRRKTIMRAAIRVHLAPCATTRERATPQAEIAVEFGEGPRQEAIEEAGRSGHEFVVMIEEVRVHQCKSGLRPSPRRRIDCESALNASEISQLAPWPQVHHSTTLTRPAPQRNFTWRCASWPKPI